MMRGRSRCIASLTYGFALIYCAAWWARAMNFAAFDPTGSSGPCQGGLAQAGFPSQE